MLAAINDIVKEGFQDYILYIEITIIYPPSLLLSPPSGFNISESTTSVISGFEYSV